MIGKGQRSEDRSQKTEIRNQSVDGPELTNHPINREGKNP
jgi:hypothetical protein